MSWQKHKWLRAVGWSMVLVMIVLSLIKLPPTNTHIPNSDKWLHLSSYFILTYWFLHTHQPQNKTIALGCILLGVLLEWLQSMTPHRYFEWLDMLMNLTGVAAAYITFHWLRLKTKWLLL